MVVPALEALRLELNAIAPNRDKASDGSVGDTSHSARPSGHNPDETGAPEDTDADRVNEVRARDFDKDLNRPGLTMEMVAQYLVTECRAGRIRWIKYIIFNRRIWSASSGWVTRTYTGSNPHDKHMHVSSKADTTSENTTRPVGLKSLVEAPDMDLNDKVGATPAYPGRTVRQFFGDTWDVRDILVGDPKAKTPASTSPLGQFVTMVRTFPALVANVNTLLTLARGEAAEVPPTAAQNAQAVVDRLGTGSPEETAAALRTVLGDRAAEVGRLLAGA